MESAQAVVAVAELWLWAGALAALAMLPALGRFEPAARGAWAFRPLLIPGFLLLWPLILWRLARRGAEDPRARHAPPLRLQAGAALALVAALALTTALALAVRQSPPGNAPEAAPVRLTAPQ